MHFLTYCLLLFDWFNTVCLKTVKLICGDCYIILLLYRTKMSKLIFYNLYCSSGCSAIITKLRLIVIILISLLSFRVSQSLILYLAISMKPLTFSLLICTNVRWSSQSYDKQADVLLLLFHLFELCNLAFNSAVPSFDYAWWNFVSSFLI